MGPDFSDGFSPSAVSIGEGSVEPVNFLEDGLLIVPEIFDLIEQFRQKLVVLPVLFGYLDRHLSCE